MNLLIALRTYDDAEAVQDVRLFAIFAHKKGHHLTLLTAEQKLPAGIHHSLKLLSHPQGSYPMAGKLFFQRLFSQEMKSGAYQASVAFCPVEGADFYVPRRFQSSRPQGHHAPTLLRQLAHSQLHAYFSYVCNRQERSLMQECGVPRARIFQLPPEFHPEYLHHNDHRGRFQVRRALNVSETQILIIQCADDWFRQGVDRSLGALAQLPPALRSTCRYALLSSHTSQSELESWAKREGLPPSLVLNLGKKRTLEEMLKAADLMLHPARAEEAGTMLVDALTANVPVICTEICGYSCFLRKTSCPIVPSPARLAALIDALSFVVQHAHTLKKMLHKELGHTDIKERAAQLLQAVETLPPLREAFLPPADIAAIVALHATNLQSAQALKNERKRATSRVAFQGRRYLVKEFKRREWWHLGSCAKRTENGTALLARYTPQLRGRLHDDANGSDYLIFGDCGESNFFLTDYAQEENAAELYGACGRLLAEIHEAGVYHQDAKPANFVRNDFCQDECALPVCIVDCDNVSREAGRLSTKRRVHNLAQFIAGTGNLARMDQSRWRQLISAFCNGYNNAAVMASGDLDQLWRRVWHAIETRQHIEYTLPEMEIALDESTLLV